MAEFGPHTASAMGLVAALYLAPLHVTYGSVLAALDFVTKLLSRVTAVALVGSWPLSLGMQTRQTPLARLVGEEEFVVFVDLGPQFLTDSFVAVSMPVDGWTTLLARRSWARLEVSANFARSLNWNNSLSPFALADGYTEHDIECLGAVGKAPDALGPAVTLALVLGHRAQEARYCTRGTRADLAPPHARG